MEAIDFLKNKGITKATCYTDGGGTYYVSELAKLMEEYAALRQTPVSGSLSEPQTEIQRERLIFQKGWCSAFNTWWKYKDENLDFREMETKLCEAMESESLEHLSNYR